jgi:hypothetical protein
MSDVSARLETARAAVDELIQSAQKSASVWTQPTAPGKWSPSQVVEHVARTLEESANVFSGKPSKFPNFPAPVRPVIRALLFDRVVKNGKFPKSRTNKPMNPLTGPATAEEGCVRLEQASDKFEKECLSCAGKSDWLDSRTFGRVSTADYVRFMEVHTRHHRKQMPDA